MGNAGREKLNISDIARLAGTSVMTVSRVLNNKPDVASATREKILKVIDENGYRPHALARKLSKGRTNIVGVALYTGGTPVDGLYVEVMQGLQESFARTDHDLLFLAPSKTDRYYSRVVNTSIIEGLVVMGNLTSEEDLEQIRGLNLPLVTIGRRGQDGISLPFVSPNYRKAFYEMVLYLSGQGARTVTVLISGLASVLHSQMAYVKERLAGVRDAVRYRRLNSSDIQFVPSDGEFTDGYQFITSLSVIPDALVLDSSPFSFGVVVALRDKGLVPERDILLAGLDYERMTIQRCEDVLRCSIPKWSVPWRTVGHRAAQNVLRQIEQRQGDDPVTHEYVDIPIADDPGFV